jgi:polysaccharide biosynthesis/export protein
MRGRMTILIVLCSVTLLAGCGASPKEGVSVQSMTPGSPPLIETQSGATAMVTDILKKTAPDKPEVSRVVLTLDQKASYSTSREGNRLIVNVFNAKMKSSLQELVVQDPVVKSISTRQVGNSVRSVVELVGPDIAYRPSTEADPFQIVIDVWPLTTSAAMPSSDGTADVVVAMPAADGADSRSRDVVLDMTPATLPSATPPTSDTPAQLQWFSEKLSEVLQERELLKQQLLESDKSFAVKDSMIQVLERKLKEANTRIVELEEELIKVKSRMSLADENEEAMRNEYVSLLTRLEEASGLRSGPIVGAPSPAALRDRANDVQARVSVLRQESQVLGESQGEVADLQAQLAAVSAERDDLQARVNGYAAEIASLKEMTAKFTAFEQELRLRENELARLRQAIGQAAQLVMEPGSSPPLRTIQPEIASAQQPSLPLAGAETPPLVESSASESGDVLIQSADNQLRLAALLSDQALAGESVGEYVLGSDDVIQIKVLKEENLDRTVTVSSDGFITFPLIGDLRVEGLTIANVDAQITALLGENYLVNPEVVVEVVKQRSKKVYIMGQVKQPGYHEIAGDQRLLGTLLSAGGPTSFNAEARLLRLPKGDMFGVDSMETMNPVIVDLQRLFVEGDQTQNVILRDGDVLMVAEKKPGDPAGVGEAQIGANQFYVVGSVSNPGVYTYKPDDTVLDAILRAGGFSEFASRNNVKVVRDANGQTRTFQVRMRDVMDRGEMDKNIAIMPGDMIIVPESFF